jgi:hypothetical protein
MDIAVLLIGMILGVGLVGLVSMLADMIIDARLAELEKQLDKDGYIVVTLPNKTIKLVRGDKQ